MCLSGNTTDAESTKYWTENTVVVFLVVYIGQGDFC